MPWCDGPKIQFSFDGESNGRTCAHGNTRPHEIWTPEPEVPLNGVKIGRTITTGMMSSHEDRYATPPKLYNALDEVFQFGYDAAADADNTKHPLYLSTEDDALIQDIAWIDKINAKAKGPEGICLSDVAFLNPPYGKLLIPFMQAACYQHHNFGTTIAMLVAGRLETDWFAIGNEHARYRLELRERVPFTEPGCPLGYVFDRDGKKDGRPIVYDFPATPMNLPKFPGIIHGEPRLVSLTDREYVMVDGVAQAGSAIGYPRMKKSQPSFPSVVLIFVNDSTLHNARFLLYKLSTLGMMIDLKAQRKINEGRIKNAPQMNGATSARGKDDGRD